MHILGDAPLEGEETFRLHECSVHKYLSMAVSRCITFTWSQDYSLHCTLGLYKLLIEREKLQKNAAIPTV